MNDYDDDHQPNVIDEQHRVLLDFMTNNDDMKKAAKSSLKQGMYAGGGAVAGGLLIGPVGGVIGGITGSIIGFMQSDNYSGMLQQMMILDATRKSHLIDAVKATLINAGASSTDRSIFTSPDAFRATLAQFAAQRTVRDQIWKACIDAINE